MFNGDYKRWPQLMTIGKYRGSDCRSHVMLGAVGEVLGRGGGGVGGGGGGGGYYRALGSICKAIGHPEHTKGHEAD